MPGESWFNLVTVFIPIAAQPKVMETATTERNTTALFIRYLLDIAIP